MQERRKSSSCWVRLCFALAMLVGVSACSGGLQGPRVIYLSLGDSLAAGIQADPATGESIETDEGYADQLFARLQQQYPNLELVKMGCPGESTTTFIEGGICDYSAGTQFQEAVDFIQANLGKIALVTIDLGANDLFQSDCINTETGVIDEACLTALFEQVGDNLGQIITVLGAATQQDAPLIGMNYYNIFLAAWLLGPEGQALALQSQELMEIANFQVLGAAYGAFGVPVADVYDQYMSTDFETLVPFPLPAPNDVVPLNVATLCDLTFNCLIPPAEPNIHPNTEGYSVIADAFQEVIDSIGGIPAN